MRKAISIMYLGGEQHTAVDREHQYRELTQLAALRFDPVNEQLIAGSRPF